MMIIMKHERLAIGWTNGSQTFTPQTYSPRTSSLPRQFPLTNVLPPISTDIGHYQCEPAEKIVQGEDVRGEICPGKSPIHP